VIAGSAGRGKVLEDLREVCRIDCSDYNGILSQVTK
jgi:hypothetical protein